MTARVKCDERLLVSLVRMGVTDERLAQALGVTTRTLTRWRAARPEMNRQIKLIREQQAAERLERHGIPARYNAGCRCDECRASQRERSIKVRRSLHERGLPSGDPRHGTSGAYANWGCRCADCVATWATVLRTQREARTAKLAADPSAAEHGRRATYNGWGCRCEPCCEAARAFRRGRTS